MNRIPANDSHPNKRGAVFNLFKDKTRVRIHRDIELGEHSKELGDDEATLIEALSEEVGVELFNLGEAVTVMENRNESRF